MAKLPGVCTPIIHAAKAVGNILVNSVTNELPTPQPTYQAIGYWK